MVLTAILSSLASVLIYSSIMNSRYRGNAVYQGGLPVNNDDNDNAISTIALSNLEKRALQVIRKRGGMITQVELGRELGLSKYQVSRLVKRLETKGVIERRRAGVTNVLILRNGFSTLDKPRKDKD
ncbi:MarR family transcriptional regulator [Vulcanisaeta sp. JCM 16161]|uniref:helix-turn-helix transcriptional regulator n=1 Tax=Vulcanisaeta sp. JCM 16161 TaxID=1295372 RepID=UPI0006CF765F|nr:MarR family transcriptional regulator [Vulcanisaeta sp. JCM 16161]